ncbi:CRISPR-associated protein Cas4 [Methanobacterium sp.]|jgi:CRISPR-associated exonuclease Cas4|uniref:CRISPR-associated protein Cas4 n=1 Tax=Methanobacterium sp. TaxID=2164 RepID=UPI003158D5C9
MISVSSISEFVYCPVKAFLNQTQKDNIQTREMIHGKLVHEIRRGYEEITKQNMWSIKENIELEYIFSTIFEEVPPFIEKVSKKYSDKYEMDYSALKDICNDLEDDLKLESQFLSLKVKKILNTTSKRGNEIAEMFFPQSLLEFSLKNEELNLMGKIDKIEVINGVYYPVEVKTGMPPSKGVWLADALQVAAYAVLMDYELNKEVLVGFVDYIKVCERRPVVVNSVLHNKLLGVLDDMLTMFEKQEIPEFKLNKKKCEKCEYADICEYYG